MSSQGAIRQALLDAAGETGHYSLDSEITPLYISLTEGLPPSSSLLDLLQQINAANGTRHFIKAADDRDQWYFYTTRNRQWRLGAAADASIDGSVQHWTAADSWRISADTVVNEQKSTVDIPTFPLAPIKVWEYSQLPPLPVTVVSGTPLVLEATFSDYVLPCTTLVIDSTGDGYTATVEDHGYASTVTYTSSGTTQITEFELWGREAVRQPSQSYQSEDTASQTLPRGVRAGPEISGDFVGSLPSAIGIAKHIVWRYANPKKRPQVTVANWLPDALQREMYDLLGMTSTQLKVSGVLFEVVGISETWERAADPASGPVVYFTTTYQLQEQTIHTRFFGCDVDTLDNATYLLAY